MNNATAPNAKRMLWAGFFCIFASGVGFGVRGRILAAWAHEYGFTLKELGDISGGGLWGFGLIIIAGSLIADRLGYSRLMVFAFVMHVLSAVLQLSTGPIYANFGRDAVYWSLTLAMVMFAFGNGMCEVVVNPMVAALFPKEKTHYLNILHAGWPGGLIAGGLIAYLMNDVVQVPWAIQMSLFLVPVAIYGVMMAGQHLPQSEASQAGVNFVTMLKEFAAPVLLVLLLVHAMVGYVELGTDNWIQKITGTITASPMTGTLLFIYTNMLMFVLRFCAGPIERRLNPLGLLLTCAVVACVGLLMLGYLRSDVAIWAVVLCVLAVTVYGIGKTFFWPTMLAVVSERFPKGGALTLGTIGGVGMLSAGLLGSPAIGFQQDYYATKQLEEEKGEKKAPTTYDRYVANEEKSFLFVFHTKALEERKVNLLELAAKKAKLEEEATEANTEKEREAKLAAAKDVGEELERTLTKLRESHDQDQHRIAEAWEVNRNYVAEDAEPVAAAGLFGSRLAIQWTAVVPATMAVFYLFLLLYFKFRGGYQRVEITKTAEEKSATAPWE